MNGKRVAKSQFFTLFVSSILFASVFLRSANAQEGEWTLYTIESEARNQEVERVAVTGDGTVWVVTWHDGMAYFDGDSWHTLHDVSESLVPDLFFYCCFAAAADGTVWLGLYQVVGRFDGQAWNFYKHRGGGVTNDFAENIFQPQGVPVLYFDSLDIPSFEIITALATDSQGALWVATTEGLVRFNGETWAGFRESDGLIANNITTLAVASDDSVWVGTSEGLSHFDGERWVNYPQAAGLFPAYGTLTSAFDSLTVAGDGTVWAVTDGSLFWFDGERWNTSPTLDAPDIGRVWTLKTGPDGAIWVGGEKGLTCYDGTHWSHYPLGENLLSGIRPDYHVAGITSLAVALDGTVWGGTSQGVVSFRLSETGCSG